MATKLPSGKYRTMVQIGDRADRTYKSFYGKTAREADVLAEQWKLANPKERPTLLSFRKAAKEYLQASSLTLAPYTIRGYTSTLNTLCDVYPDFVKIEITEIRKQDLQMLYNALLAAGKKPKTVRNYNGFISSVMSFYDIPMPKTKLPEWRQPDLNIPDEKALSRLIQAVKGTRMEIPVLLGMRGLRRGEVCAVRASDLEGNVLHIQRAMTLEHGQWKMKVPKTAESDRLVPLPPELAAEIRKKGRATDMNPQELSLAFRRIVRNKKNKLPQFRFHDLRHAFVSIAHANNIPEAYVMAMGGWSTNHTMQRVYRHTLDKHTEKYQKQMEDIFSSL